MPLYYLPAAVLLFYSFSPSSLHQARGHLKDKHLGHWLKRGREGESKERSNREGQQVEGDLVKKKQKDWTVCVRRRRTFGELLKETEQCIKGECKRERGKGIRKERGA